jgi:hypothetical protein
MAQQHSNSYVRADANTIAALQTGGRPAIAPSENSIEKGNVSAINSACYFCGRSRHPRNNCPAKDATCNKCSKIGHFSKVCRSSKVVLAAVHSPNLATISAASPYSLVKATPNIYVNDIRGEALVDTGSSDSFFSSRFVKSHHWPIAPSKAEITMDSTSLCTTTEGFIRADIKVNGTPYRKQKLSVMNDLCADVILGHDFLKLHERIDMLFGCSKSVLTICGLSTIVTEPVSLFSTMDRNFKPVAVKSRHHSSADTAFIDGKIKRLLSKDIIEPSISPWRAQVLVTSNQNHKRRMVVDYSQTVNYFTSLDAYPLSKINTIIYKVTQFKVFSTVDLKSAYHQIPIVEADKPFTSFEASTLALMSAVYFRKPIKNLFDL